MLGVQGTNPNTAATYMAATYFEYHGIEPGAYYGLEYRRVSKVDVLKICYSSLQWAFINENL